jgi:cell wall assembly regulator SMI1
MRRITTEYYHANLDRTTNMNTRLAQLLARLEYFEAGAIRLAPPAPSDWIASCEDAIGHRFSPQVREFLLVHNGCEIVEIMLYGVPRKPKSSRKGLNILTRFLDNTVAEDWNKAWVEDWNKAWLELGRDGFGNYFVADLANPDAAGEYPILLVDHEAVGRPNAARYFADDYFTFMAQVIDEMIQLYEPDGKRRRNV